MLFAALGAVTAVWLAISSLFDVDTGARTVLAVGVGVAALALAPLGVWLRAARWSLAVLGLLLAMTSLLHPPPTIGALANYVACAAALVVAGIGPEPQSEVVRPMGMIAPTARSVDSGGGVGVEKHAARVVAAA